MANPHGPIAAPIRRKIATSGKPLRSIAPESRDATTMTISATEVTQFSNYPRSVFRKYVIRITVHPALTNLPRRYHRVTGCARVLRGVLVRRIVAASSAAALLTRSQMHPLGADLDAVFTFPPLGQLDGFYRFDV